MLPTSIYIEFTQNRSIHHIPQVLSRFKYEEGHLVHKCAGGSSHGSIFNSVSTNIKCQPRGSMRQVTGSRSNLAILCHLR